MVTKIANNNFTILNFIFVNKNAPKSPPIMAAGIFDNSPLSNAIYSRLKYRKSDTIEIGSIVATAFAKIVFCISLSFFKTL